MPEPIILGLESSCDDTAAAVLRGREILSSVVMGQTELHAAFGGVVPEIAARAHAEKLDGIDPPVVAKRRNKPRLLRRRGVGEGSGIQQRSYLQECRMAKPSPV